jgi:hypothetical protein
MTDEAHIREKLAKIKALFRGATTPGERLAAQAAIDRLQQRIDGIPSAGPAPVSDPPIEYRFSLSNAWSLRLFLALARSKGYRPYRHPRMRRTSVCLMIGKAAVDADLWPEYLEMNRVLTEYLGELADHIIADCIDPDRSDAEVVAGLPGPASAGGAGPAGASRFKAPVRRCGGAEIQGRSRSVPGTRW